MGNWNLERLSKNVHRIHIDGAAARDWEQWVLLTGDRHFDSPDSLRSMQRRHLEEARERDAPVIDVGDFFDAMGGRHDPRAEKKTLLGAYKKYLKAHPGTNTEEFQYLDFIVDEAAEWFEPYADTLAVIGYGNHETKILKHEETDILKRFVHRLNERAGSDVQTGGYGGWVIFQFVLNNSERYAIRLRYFHGTGGGGAVTKGVIQTNRRAVIWPDAHIVISGHIHESWQVSITRERINRTGRVRLDEQLHVSIPSYKEEYNQGHMGWHVETGKPPKPTGAVWLRFYYVDPYGKGERRRRAIKYQAIRAI